MTSNGKDVGRTREDCHAVLVQGREAFFSRLRTVHLGQKRDVPKAF